MPYYRAYTQLKRRTYNKKAYADGKAFFYFPGFIPQNFSILL
jgi:hypothetical protein